MRSLDGVVVWSATDLVTAARCEYRLLRELDAVLGRAPRPCVATDPLADQLARIGERHEIALLEEFRAEHGGRLVELARAPYGSGAPGLLSTHEATVRALRSGATAVYQGGFFDGEFTGYADFLMATEDGWLVADAKLARQARPPALLQLAAYAEQVHRAGLATAPSARLLLGDGLAQDFALADLMPVFRERRQRLRALLAEHRAGHAPVAWGRDDLLACGRCVQCQAAVEQHRDLLLVARMRPGQRRVLREAGITTLADLARAREAPEGLAEAAFASLRAQARLQLRQLDAPPGPDGEPVVSFEVLDPPQGLALLPDPSPGDVFFDFEGDPLYREDDPAVWGLEYLWGVIEAPVDGAEPRFRAWWAHDRVQEKAAFVAFMDYLAERRLRHPDLHVYHYAAYETTALKRLAARYATHESELDDLLRSVVFVDLYSVVRGAVRVSQPSYSIKKLEPLYMGDEDRGGMDVAAGDASIAEYHEYRTLLDHGEPEEAAARLTALEEYNRYDCVSTLRLRDWLLGLGGDGPRAAPRGEEVTAPEPDEEHDELVQALGRLSGPAERVRRTDDEQAAAMLASAMGYHRRESLPFWWEHFSRLGEPDLAAWSRDRDVFRVTAVEVLGDWERPTPRSNLARTLRLHGQWAPGSSPRAEACAVYALPGPPGSRAPHRGFYGWADVRDIVVGEEEDHVEVVQRLTKTSEEHDHRPVALTPASPPPDGDLRAAIREVAARVVAAGALPHQPALDLLRRLPPRVAGGSLPDTGDTVADLTAALLALDGSYLAVQGPPGTGKTYTGSHVIARLVREHGWRVGVVAQSHAVVENMLSAVVRAGLDPALVGKKQTRTAGAPWVDLDVKGQPSTATFLSEHRGGCVLGGTQWNFVAKAMERGSLDLLVVDEAGQFALANAVAVSVSAQRLLLLGDPQQLPQVSQGTHGEPVHTSALRWLMQDRATGQDLDTLPPHLGYFLAQTYRMHPALCAKVSALSYDGRLESAAVASERELVGVAPGLRTVRATESVGASVASPEEADEVVRQVAALLGTPWRESAAAPTRPLTQRDVLVVAPYNAQVALIRRRLRDAGHPDVRVGTVDKFQGQEAPVVIVSMTASSPDDVPRGMGFLLHRNRVNVAVSRAQWLAVLIRSPRLTSFLPGTTGGLLELGAFIGLCEVPGP